MRPKVEGLVTGGGLTGVADAGHGAAAMTPARFKAWRKRLGLKQKDVADLLGLKKRVIQYYERGRREGKAVEIPKSVELACWALAQGIAGYDGDRTATPLANSNKAVASDGKAE